MCAFWRRLVRPRPRGKPHMCDQREREICCAAHMRPPRPEPCGPRSSSPPIAVARGCLSARRAGECFQKMVARALLLLGAAPALAARSAEALDATLDSAAPRELWARARLTSADADCTAIRRSGACGSGASGAAPGPGVRVEALAPSGRPPTACDHRRYLTGKQPPPLCARVRGGDGPKRGQTQHISRAHEEE